jgi:hypothetical protein
VSVKQSVIARGAGAEGDSLLFVAGCGEERSHGGDVFKADEVGDRLSGVEICGIGYIFQRFVDSAGADAELLDGILHGADLVFDLLHEAAVVFELFFRAGEDAPDLVPFFLDGEGVEAHLKAGEDGHEGGWAGDGDAALLLNFGLEAGTPHDFGVEGLGGEEHDGVRHGGGWVDVLVADAFAFGADGFLERLTCGGDLVGVSGLVGVLEAFPVFLGELGVDSEERVALRSVAVGELEGVLDRLECVGFDAGVLDVLLGGEHLLELLAELEFADDATGFDVGEDSLEVADACS